MFSIEFFSWFWIKKSKFILTLWNPSMWFLKLFFSKCGITKQAQGKHIFTFEPFENVFSIEFSSRFWIKKKKNILTSWNSFMCLLKLIFSKCGNILKIMNHFDLSFKLLFFWMLNHVTITKSILMSKKSWNPSFFKSKVWLICFEYELIR